MEEQIDELGHLAAELGARKTLIFLLHYGNDPSAARAFQQLASLSGGAYLPFNLSAIARLCELLAAIAVYAVGGLTALEKHAAGKSAVLQITSQLKR